MNVVIVCERNHGKSIGVGGKSPPENSEIELEGICNGLLFVLLQDLIAINIYIVS